MTLYNENDPFAAQWLRNLQTVEKIGKGPVDERSITELRDADVAGHTRAHFFAGIAGWELALRLAGWPEDRPVWTGSCPCQPFSAAGKRKGHADERHLWPAWFRLIRECRPDTIFGEQVANAIGHGWLDLVFTDLEKEGYTCGAVVLGAHSVGAPHIRQRVWWVAHAENSDRRAELRLGSEKCGRAGFAGGSGLGDSTVEGPLSSPHQELHRREKGPGTRYGEFERSGKLGGLEHTQGNGREQRGTESGGRGAVSGCGESGLGDSEGERRIGGPHDRDEGRGERPPGYSNPWADSIWLPCADGKARPIKPGLAPLAHGVSGRVGQLRAYGNAICVPLAAEFIKMMLAPSGI